MSLERTCESHAVIFIRSPRLHTPALDMTSLSELSSAIVFRSPLCLGAKPEINQSRFTEDGGRLWQSAVAGEMRYHQTRSFRQAISFLGSMAACGENHHQQHLTTTTNDQQQRRLRPSIVAPLCSLTCGHVNGLYVVLEGLDDVGDVLHTHLIRLGRNVSDTPQQ